MKDSINITSDWKTPLEPLLQPVNNQRLKGCWLFDLQGTLGDIAGWTPNRDIVIHHHISL